MQTLGNNELGFDPNTLGFPSIHTCHAIVYQTAVGLFGYHSMGGQTPAAWQPRAVEFARFVRDHQGAIPAGTRLYGCAFVCDGGRYFPANQAKQLWKQELVAFAAQLNYVGRISGYRLQKTVPFPIGGHVSAYVEYVANGPKSDVAIRAWGDNEHLPAPTANATRDDHKRLHPVHGPVDIDQTVKLGVQNGLTGISKERLR